MKEIVEKRLIIIMRRTENIDGEMKKEGENARFSIMEQWDQEKDRKHMMNKLKKDKIKNGSV